MTCENVPRGSLAHLIEHCAHLELMTQMPIVQIAPNLLFYLFLTWPHEQVIAFLFSSNVKPFGWVTSAAILSISFCT